MGKIVELLSSQLVGGTGETKLYPITHVKGVYDGDNNSLDNVIKSINNTITTNYNTLNTKIDRLEYLKAGDNILEDKTFKVQLNSTDYGERINYLALEKDGNFVIFTDNKVDIQGERGVSIWANNALNLEANSGNLTMTSATWIKIVAGNYIALNTSDIQLPEGAYLTSPGKITFNFDEGLEIDPGEGTIVISGESSLSSNALNIKGNTALNGNLSITGTLKINGVPVDPSSGGETPDLSGYFKKEASSQSLKFDSLTIDSFSEDYDGDTIKLNFNKPLNITDTYDINISGLSTFVSKAVFNGALTANKGLETKLIEATNSTLEIKSWESEKEYSSSIRLRGDSTTEANIIIDAYAGPVIIKGVSLADSTVSTPNTQGVQIVTDGVLIDSGQGDGLIIKGNVTTDKDMSVGGDVTITGNLTVNGTITGKSVYKTNAINTLSTTNTANTNFIDLGSIDSLTGDFVPVTEASIAVELLEAHNMGDIVCALKCNIEGKQCVLAINSYIGNTLYFNYKTSIVSIVLNDNGWGAQTMYNLVN
jgi:hypothetical protein